MPQITVTIEDDIYFDLMNLPKGLKSKYVNNAIRRAHVYCTKLDMYDPDPRYQHMFARGRITEIKEEEE
jgi:hypothetical protein